MKKHNPPKGQASLLSPSHTSALSRLARLALVLVAFVFLLSCASRYFSALPAPRETLKIQSLDDLPRRELWQGIVFNGEKIGFAHLKIVPMPEVNQYQILSEASLRLRFMGMEKHVSMKGDDRIRPDLTMVSFHYEQKMDEKPLVLDGNTAENTLMILQKSGAVEKSTAITLAHPLYPTSVINLYPVFKGMAVGSHYRYHVYDPQTQSMAEVDQSVIAFEESTTLSLEPAFKIETRMHGHSATSWITMEGDTIFELGIGGVLITYRENEDSAKRFLAEASMNKKDLIFDFSLVKTDTPITCPRNVVFLEMSAEGLSGQLPPLQGPHQEVSEHIINGRPVTMFRIHRAFPEQKEAREEPLPKGDHLLYLAATHHIESGHPEIIKTVHEVLQGTLTATEKIERLVKWVSSEIKDEVVDSFSAADVLHTRKGECQAHAMLYTAMARAADIPTKMAGGIVYMEGMGFLYHSWAESYAGRWIAVDPTLNQVGVDATHIKLIEGHDWTSLLPIAKVVGQVKITKMNYSCGQ